MISRPPNDNWSWKAVGKNSAPAKLFSTQQMRDIAALKGVDLDAQTIFYCDTGVKCSLGWFALHELLGNERTRVYDGSMHAWSSLEPSSPVVALAQMTKEGVAETTERPTTGGTLQTVAIRAPRSLQTLVDERRDALRRAMHQRPIAPQVSTMYNSTT